MNDNTKPNRQYEGMDGVNYDNTKAAPQGAWLFEHDDGRHTIHCGEGSPAFTHNDPAWHRVGPVSLSDTASSDESCPHGDSHIVHDCLRCGAPVCCEKCCARDAYEGAREDLLDWKKRALEAEDLVHKLTRKVNGPTFMGEPAPAAEHARPEVPMSVIAAIMAYGDARADDDGTSAARLSECVREIRNALASSTPPAAESAGQEGKA